MSAADPLEKLGVVLGTASATIGVYSASAARVDVLLYADADAPEPEQVMSLKRDARGVFRGRSTQLRVGRVYALRVDGPHAPTRPADPPAPAGADASDDGPIPPSRFDPTIPLLDPYARGIVPGPPAADGRPTWRSVVVDRRFDWNGAAKPNTHLDRTVVYEAHVKGFTKLQQQVPQHLRGTYAGLASDESLAYLTGLGVTAVELLPVHAFTSEERLVEHGLTNYWGYNSLGFFAPHAPYASEQARAGGASGVLREFKGMVKRMHEAGLEVILDVVYNHTAEAGPDGPTSSFRGIDDATYYRQDATGDYIDVTGCGNTVDFSKPAPQRLVLDSLRYWANEVQIDGFRFDLATTLGRDGDMEYDPQHPLLTAIRDDPALEGVKLIAEPWDVGLGGWQTGNFPDGWSEWNDRYRNRMRDFWLRDIVAARYHGTAGSGIGRFATRFAGSANTFGAERGPLASVNYITAHDGFTMWDLVSYNVKHNRLNGEQNRDGTTHNLSYNHGYEGDTRDVEINRVRRKAVRNLLGTLLLSAGVPMLTAGDEYGRTQHGNNNAYCQDDEITWLRWERDEWQRDLEAHVRRLIRLRAGNPALRPRRYAQEGAVVPSASQMHWYDGSGAHMSEPQWNSAEHRTLQYIAVSTPEIEQPNCVLVIVHALEDDTLVWLPRHDDVRTYTMLWDSADERPLVDGPVRKPGTVLRVAGTSMQLYRCD